MLSADDIAYMIAHSGAKAVIAHTSFRTTIEAIGSLPAEVSVKLAVADDSQSLAGFRMMELEDAPGPGPWPEPSGISSSANALIIYTGGTTGRPKGVVHTQRGLFLNMLSHQVNLGIREDDRLLVCSPLPHSAQLFAEATLLRGGMVWIEPAFDAGRVLQVIDEERLTLTFMVPTMIYRLLDHPDTRTTDTSSVRTIVYGASPITPTRLQQALDRFGPVLLQIYGQTEVPNLITTLSKDDHLEEKYRTSCGQAVQFVDIAVRDAEGNRLPFGQVGEVTVRSSYSLERYHEDPARTAEAHIGDHLRTGDVGYLDETGHLYLVDRAKDMIISGGFNVYSTEVENVIQQYDRVQQVAVIGIPDDEWGEAVTAFVIPKGDDFEISRALDQCRDKLARYKVPKTIRLVQEIPLTAYGKPDKKALRAQFWGHQERQVN
jgi:fatty-acyl-CoA synthase/long-chain acyl-CoA synthetase